MSPDADNGPVQSLNMPETQDGYIHGGPDRSGGDKSSTDPRSGMALPNPGAVATPAQSVAMPQHQPSQPASTSDDDDMSIEKEVIAKARAIVQRTSQDPYLQAKEIGRVKAELLKRRYGTDIKLSEG